YYSISLHPHHFYNPFGSLPPGLRTAIHKTLKICAAVFPCEQKIVVNGQDFSSRKSTPLTEFVARIRRERIGIPRPGNDLMVIQKVVLKTGINTIHSTQVRVQVVVVQPGMSISPGGSRG